MGRAGASWAFRIALVLLLWVSSASASIGFDNKNFGNVIPNDWHRWPGATGIDPYGHAIFKDDLHGMRAIKKVLRCYHKRHKIQTAYGIAKRYINKQATHFVVLDYAKTLSQFTGKAPNAILNMDDRRVLMKLAHGIVRHENGYDTLPEKLYERVFLNEP